MVEGVWGGEGDKEPLDTPERRAGLKARLRQLAGSIADKDLQQAYREDLLQRLDALSPRAQHGGDTGGRQGRGNFGQSRGWRGAGPAWIDPAPTAMGRAAAQRLARSLDPLAAAMVAHALADPSVLDDHLEDAFAAQGFGDPGLVELTREIIRFRLETDHLDSGALARHLASCGFTALLTDIDQAAAKSGAPIMKSDVSLDSAKSQWSHAFAGLSRLAALDEAITSAKGNLSGRSDMEALERLKGERDALKRAIRTGTIWAGDGS